MQVAMHMHRGFTSKVPFLQVASRPQHTARRMQHNNLSIASMHRGRLHVRDPAPAVLRWECALKWSPECAGCTGGADCLPDPGVLESAQTRCHQHLAAASPAWYLRVHGPLCPH
jgi:hypothetical protein